MTLPPLLFALALWFVGTGAVVWLDSRPRSTFRASFFATGMLALAALGAIWATRNDAGEGAAYLGFAAAIVVWAWHEVGFLQGFVAGPNREPCPVGVSGWRRFRLAAATVIHHEVALAVTAALIIVLTWGAANQAAALCFLLLFAMRLSAKLNLYLGVPNLSDEIFPEHLAYLKTYFRVRALNPLFPFSVAGGLTVAWLAWGAAEAASGGTAVTATLIAGLAVLGVVEHLFLVLPMRDGAMWRWASARKSKQAGTWRGRARHGL